MAGHAGIVNRISFSLPSVPLWQRITERIERV
jgi:hypothetical protein